MRVLVFDAETNSFLNRRTFEDPDNPGTYLGVEIIWSKDFIFSPNPGTTISQTIIFTQIDESMTIESYIDDYTYTQGLIAKTMNPKRKSLFFVPLDNKNKPRFEQAYR
jgi:hypothetical protein